ncbi:MAG: FAD-binding oxidoreductase, partial [Alphaproteobacteria bacterium]
MTAIDRIRATLPPAAWTDDPDLIAPHLTEWRGLFTGKTSLMATPRTVHEVAQVVQICRETRTPITVQGGNTGLVGGAIPDESGEEILVTISKLNKIRNID